MALERYDEAIAVCERVFIKKKETTLFKVASEFSAFMELIGHCPIQNSPLRIFNTPCFVDQNSSLHFTYIYSR
jgi:hypothetical protein